MIAALRDPCYRYLFPQVSDGSGVAGVGSKIVRGSTPRDTGSEGSTMTTVNHLAVRASDISAHPWLSFIAALAILAVVYLLICWIWPWAHCGGEWLPWPRKCDGGRVYQNPRRKTWRDCRHCGGTGKRRRVGRVVWAYFIRAKRKADAR